MTICPNCGSNQEDDSIFCDECGFKINDKAEPFSKPLEPRKNPPGKKKIRFVKHKK